MEHFNDRIETFPKLRYLRGTRPSNMASEHSIQAKIYLPSAILLLLALFGIYFLKLCCFDVPRQRREIRKKARERRQLIGSRIINRTVTSNLSVLETDNWSSSRAQTSLFHSTSRKGKTNGDGKNLEFECPICFEKYIEKDQICWSKNPKCNHTFHSDCVIPWLMNHDNCPICRNDYLSLTSYDSKSQEITNNGNQDNDILNVSVGSSLGDSLHPMYRISILVRNTPRVIEDNNPSDSQNETPPAEKEDLPLHMNIESGLNLTVDKESAAN